MPSRQDQLHSYQFMVQRVVGALVMRETDPAQSPFRRAAGATLASVLIALIAVGGSVVYGLFVGGGATKWKDASVVIVEKESGAQYVYYENKLHPVLNYSSALLIIGQGAPKTVSVSRKSLQGEPRGVLLGIRDIPESLPPANVLIGGAWTICSGPRAGDAGQATQSTLLLGQPAVGGRELAGDEGMLALHPDGRLYLLWNERKYLVRDRDLVVNALTWRGVRQVPVAPALLNGLPSGPDLARIPIPEAGEPFGELPDAKIGDVFAVKGLGGSDVQYAVAKRDGLYNITELQANLLITDLNQQNDPRELSSGTFNGMTKRGNLLPVDDASAPATTPTMVSAEGSVVCGDVPDDRGVQALRVGADLSKVVDPPPTRARSDRGGVLADRVVLEAGRGVVVEAAASPGATGGAISVISDQGRSHPVTNVDVLANLGYGTARRVKMPASLVSLIPQGPALDPDKARNPGALE